MGNTAYFNVPMCQKLGIVSLLIFDRQRMLLEVALAVFNNAPKSSTAVGNGMFNCRSTLFDSSSKVLFQKYISSGTIVVNKFTFNRTVC